MATALATLEQFDARHAIDVGQEDLVAALLDDASALIRDEAGDSSSVPWVLDEDGAAIPPAITAICIACAYRAWRNPDALSRSSLGAAAYDFKGDDPDALFLTDRECRVIRRSAKAGTFRSQTLVSPYSGDDEESLLDS